MAAWRRVILRGAKEITEPLDDVIAALEEEERGARITGVADLEQRLDRILAAMDALEALTPEVRQLRGLPAEALQQRLGQELSRRVAEIEAKGGDPADDEAVRRMLEDIDAPAASVKNRALLPKLEYARDLLETVQSVTALAKQLLVRRDLREAPGVISRLERYDARLAGVGEAVDLIFDEPSRSDEPVRRPAIPERVRAEVWRRDQGRCVDCGSRVRLEFDHIIPLSKGGSNTARNLELRCEACNRRKGASI